MSLNGLDDPTVKEAHDFAAAEPGGWFLLKYVSRDVIELLGHGNGGIVEIRNTIAQQEELAPLFGFLRYRRRNVLIKYVPEECSRLVQARVTVHFNAVAERFSPHDTLFPIATSKELRDTTLSAACSLHTASGSTSSSTSSLRRRRLMEIAEDEEEDNRAAKRQSTVPEERPPTAKAQSISGEQGTHSLSPPRAEIPSNLPTLADYYSKFSDLETSPPPPREPSSSELRPHTPPGVDSEPRKSLSSARPEIYNTTSCSERPKVKLGPRPSLDVGGRPHTSGFASYYRPVSSLPAGLKIFSRGSKKGEKDRPQSQFPLEAPSMTVSPPVPEDLLTPSQNTTIRPHTSGGRPATSSGASIRPSISPSLNNTPKLPFITPERARLMKALELRKKQKQMSAAIPTDIVLPNPQDGLISPTTTANRTSNEVAAEAQESLSMMDGMAKADDSGIAFDTNSTLKTDESDATRSDSYPVSPTGLSEGDRSTRASSISGSTDETIQEAIATKPNPSPEPESNRDSSNTNLETTQNSEKVTIRKDPTDPDFLKYHDPHLPEILPISDEPVAAEAKATPQPVETTTPVPEIAVSECHVTAVEEMDVNSELVAQPVEEASVASSDTVTVAEQTPSGHQRQTVEKEAALSAAGNQTPAESPSKHWKVPRSKFSVQDLKAADVIPDVPKELLPSSPDKLIVTPVPKSPAGSTVSSYSRRSYIEGDQEHGGSSSKGKNRRAGIVEPIRTDLDPSDRSGANSADNFSSDDDLMDELQSAVVQEAKPVQVSKSPSSPVFPSPKKRNTEPIKISRTPLNQKENEVAGSSLLLQTSQAGRSTSRSVSASAAYLNRINQQPAKPIAKKVNLGSGISQRIKALERLSSIPPGADQIALSTGPPPGTSPAFFAVKKGSVRDASRSPSIADRANSLNRNTPSPGPSHESSPETLKIRERSGSIQTRVDAFKLGPVLINQSMRTRPESVSVTARIIRDPHQPYPAKSEAGKDPLDYAPLDLKESPLVIDHQKAIIEPPKETILERRQSRERKLSNASKTTNTTVKERRSSITVIKDLINDTRTSFSERRRSITLEPGVSSPRLRSPSRPPSTHASPSHHRPMSISSRMSTSSKDLPNAVNTTSPPPTSGSLSSNNSENGDKKPNRASRMIRRMSSSLSASRKTIAHALSPTVREETEPATENHSLGSSIALTAPETPTSIDIGDVNVQFPDTLLWKRRSMLLDSQGYLIMSPALTAHGSGKDKAHSGANRRFHLNEFRTPSIPDVDMMEMPNSVVLDFLEGGGLQIACEDRAGQKRILKALQEAHHQWAAFGQ